MEYPLKIAFRVIKSVALINRKSITFLEDTFINIQGVSEKNDN